MAASRRWRVAFGVTALLMLGAGLWVARPWLRAVWPSRPLARRPRGDDPPSPYWNTRPGVKYVGDAACAGCHREIAEAYRTHPMGRSLGPVGEVSPERPVVPQAGIAFEAAGFSYAVENRGGKVIHKETRRDRSGQVLSEVEAEVLYALGSGASGVSYLFERDGFLFQSPISWYSQEKRWDLSPGYDRDNPHFGRPIQTGCVFCHANLADPVVGTENQYRAPTFRGHAVGCERCHGPGELHVDHPSAAGEADLTIVNPGKLAPVLRDSVCQQCHLLSMGRVIRAGRELFDYRPGLPLRRFLAVFQKTEAAGDFRALRHEEQMRVSRCSTASAGRLGCTSCHDPHRLPPASGKAAYFRTRCLACHQQHGCSAPPAVRQARGDDCVSCHMPRQPLSNMVHTAATNHCIPRVAGAARPASSPPVSATAPGQVPLVDFFAEQMTDAEQRDAGRDLGVALTLVGQSMRQSPGTSRMAGTLALPLLREGLAARPDDLPAREAEGNALWFMGRTREAIDVFRSVAAAAPAPGRESALWSLARSAGELADYPLARDTLRKALGVNPWNADYHLALAQVDVQLGDWTSAAAACRDAMRLNPALLDARALLVRTHLHAGDAPRARAEFETLVGFTPASREVWEEWFQTQQAEAGRKSGR
jgi:predicted CXXCH cytochrome family protein